MTEDWTVGRVVSWAADDFRRRGIESPRFEAELLLAHALKIDRMRIIIEPARALDDGELARYRDLIRRRRAGEPVAYIRGEKEFYGRVFHIDQRVLVPRPDTEILVDTALRRTTASSMGGRYLDLCTGSGCVAVSLAKERPTCKVFAVDLSLEALAVAEDNAIRLGAIFPMVFLHGDLYEPLEAFAGLRFELITANPPYIADADFATLPADVRGFEPRIALTGGPDGLAVMSRVVSGARAKLRPGGVLAVEMGAGQSEGVRALFAKAGFSEIAVDNDYGGHERVVSGVSARS
ncbi:MAG TPA: peptide chain release factor N(5)-glutamine methyltransferase [Polyangiaceae bacterium]|nr:peptide chain release factor N(5)-glutamine methyltransferase [Polyangiaceae bacterium]